MNHDFELFLKNINDLSKNNPFPAATNLLTEQVGKLTKDSLTNIVREIGTIPESIEASSTEEKLYSKASDVILSRCFVEFGLKAKAVSERGNSADIIAESIHGYTLVADAKTFRMSRTAKNQKDFKISTLSNWRGMEHDFALLVSPYFQYPSTNSQIYSSSLDNSVCLLSWEHILFLLINDVVENDSLSLEQIWNAPKRIERDSKIAYADRQNCLFPYINKFVCDRISKKIQDFEELLKFCKIDIAKRGDCEIQHIDAEIDIIKGFSREKAVSELIKSRKLEERISSIKSFIKSLE